MGKSKRSCDKEYSEVQRLRKENDRLKKNLSSLRRQLQRIDLDRYHNLKEVIEKQDQYEKEQEDLANVEILKKKWKCKKCHSGHLEIMKFNKLEETWYYRQCVNCDNRTMAKRFTDKVLGIFHFAEDNKK